MVGDDELGTEPMTELYVGPVGPISVVHEFSPAEIAQGRADAAVADALHTPEELQSGMYHESAGVRKRVVDRLIARGFDHPDTIPTLVDALRNDPHSDPRFKVAMVLYRFGRDPRIIDALVYAMNNDPDDEVRSEAMSTLDRLRVLES